MNKEAGHRRPPAQLPAAAAQRRCPACALPHCGACGWLFDLTELYLPSLYQAGCGRAGSSGLPPPATIGVALLASTGCCVSAASHRRPLHDRRTASHTGWVANEAAVVSGALEVRWAPGSVVDAARGKDGAATCQVGAVHQTLASSSSAWHCLHGRELLAMESPALVAPRGETSTLQQTVHLCGLPRLTNHAGQACC